MPKFKKNRILLKLTALLLLLVMLPACAAETIQDPDPTDNETSPSGSPNIVIPQGPAGVSTFGVAYAPTASMNPLTTTSRLNKELMPLLYQGLFVINADFEAVPQLCSSFSSDGMNYTFTIMDGIFFADGTPLTADDVVYSIEFARTESAYYAPRLADVSTVYASSTLEVSITLSRVYGRLELLLDIPIIKKDSGKDSAPPGTGNYTYVKNGDESYLKVSDYNNSDRTLSIKRIELIESPEKELLIDFYEAGLISVVSNDPNSTDAIAFGGDNEVWGYRTSLMVYLGLNTKTSIFRDSKLRAAFSRIIDREMICQNDLHGLADPAVLPVSPYSGLYSETLAEAGSFSFEGFLEELTVLGISDTDGDGLLNRANGANLALKFIVNSDNPSRIAAAERIAESLRSAGVTVSLSELRWEAFNEALESGDYDIYIGEVRLRNDFDLAPLVSAGGALNYSGYSNAELDALLDAYRAAPDASAAEASEALFTELLSEAPIIPILFRYCTLLAKRGTLRSVTALQDNIYYNIAEWRS